MQVDEKDVQEKYTVREYGKKLEEQGLLSQAGS